MYLQRLIESLQRFSLGTHEGLVRKCLQQLEKITVAMSKEVVDDVHLSLSTSRLVQNIVGNVKQTLIRVQHPGTGSAGPSREHSRPQSPHGNEGTHDQHQPEQQPHAANLTQLSPEYYMNDPLAGIQARPLADLDSQTFVPPPNFNLDGHDMEFGLPDDVHLDPSMADLTGDWIALPLDNIWQTSDETKVDQGFGGIGPTLGGRDLLEALTNRNYNQMQWNGTQAFGFGDM